MDIKLPCGLVTEIDECDASLLDIFPGWRIANGRVILTRYIKTEYGSLRQDVYLARAIAKPPREFDVDHKDRNPLNNKRSNLRFATKSQNVINRAKSSGKTSEYRGVSYAKKAKSNPWRVYSRTPNGKRYHGSFASEVQAAMAADQIAITTWGEFAPLNFPEGHP